MSERKFEVSGTDDDGDVWTFSTTDRERANGVFAQMREDFTEVKLRVGNG
ncbi:hypothetical protein ACFQRC_07310 [Enterovirga sp. GCM10030262]